jgi:hypothetical protein
MSYDLCINHAFLDLIILHNRPLDASLFAVFRSILIGLICGSQLLFRGYDQALIYSDFSLSLILLV